MHCCCMLENTGSAKNAFYCQFRSVFGQIPFQTGFRTEISKSDVVRKIGRFGSTGSLLRCSPVSTKQLRCRSTSYYSVHDCGGDSIVLLTKSSFLCMTRVRIDTRSSKGCPVARLCRL